MGNKLNILLVSGNTYPESGAAAIRQGIYSNGLTELGNQVTIVSYNKATESDASYNFEIHYANNEGKEKTDGLNKLKQRTAQLKECSRIINKLDKSKKIDIAVVLSTDYLSVAYFQRILKKKNIPVVHERTEYPFVVQSNIPGKKILHYFYLKYLIPRFDGIYVINKALMKYFKEFISNKCILREITSVVDPIFFEKFKTPIFDFDYLAYCGTMYGDKDGVVTMIHSYKKFLSKYPNIKLVLVGNNSDKLRMKPILTAIEGIDENVVFTGFQDRKNTALILKGAKALLLARPANKQAEGGFPSKLGEYLSTKKPVIVTKVGEIEDYLQNQKSAFLAEPDSIESFYQKLLEVFGDYDLAKKVGENGCLVAKNNFGYLAKAQELTNLFQEVILAYGRRN